MLMILLLNEDNKHSHIIDLIREFNIEETIYNIEKIGEYYNFLLDFK